MHQLWNTQFTKEVTNKKPKYNLSTFVQIKTFDQRIVHTKAQIPFGLAGAPLACNPHVRAKLRKCYSHWTPIEAPPLGKCYSHCTIIEAPTFGRSQTPLPILKSEKDAVSRASTDAVGSLLFAPKKEQFWNASRLLAIRRFNPLRLSLRTKSSLWYLEDGISKSNGPKDSGCKERNIKIRSIQKKLLKINKYIVNTQFPYKKIYNSLLYKNIFMIPLAPLKRMSRNL